MKILQIHFELKRSATSNMVYGELGIFPVRYNTVISFFWTKLINCYREISTNNNCDKVNSMIHDTFFKKKMFPLN
jgi:hypothetical protein